MYVYVHGHRCAAFRSTALPTKGDATRNKTKKETKAEMVVVLMPLTLSLLIWSD